MKIAVYTIALNEAAQAERWANSAMDADYRVVADTGSTDNTVEILARLGVTVHEISIRPWRFDDARNAALALIPSDADVCLCMDMDEFLDPGWRPQLEGTWTPETTAVYCQLALRSSLDDPMPKTWPAKKFHSRWNYRFRRPVHESLFYVGEQESSHRCDGILIHHIQDRTKPTRKQYLPLLGIAHKEDPNDSQVAFWLGRDLMYADRNEEAGKVLLHYLELPGSTWNEERTEAMRYLSRIQPDKKLFWLEQARMETPHRREIWLDLAEEYHAQEDWLTLFWACANGIEKTHRTGSYLDDNNAWWFRLHDLGAIACWHLNMMDQAVEWGQKALDLDPDNQRLKNNQDFFIRRREEVRAGG